MKKVVAHVDAQGEQTKRDVENTLLKAKRADPTSSACPASPVALFNSDKKQPVHPLSPVPTTGDALLYTVDEHLIHNYGKNIFTVR